MFLLEFSVLKLENCGIFCIEFYDRFEFILDIYRIIIGTQRQKEMSPQP